MTTLTDDAISSSIPFGSQQPLQFGDLLGMRRDHSLLLLNDFLLFLQDPGEDRDDVHRVDPLPVLRGDRFRQVLGDESRMPLLPVGPVDKGHRAKPLQHIHGLLRDQRFDLILDLPAGLEREFARAVGFPRLISEKGIVAGAVEIAHDRLIDGPGLKSEEGVVRTGGVDRAG